MDAGGLGDRGQPVVGPVGCRLSQVGGPTNPFSVLPVVARQRSIRRAREFSGLLPRVARWSPVRARRRRLMLCRHVSACQVRKDKGGFPVLKKKVVDASAGSGYF